MKRRTCSIDKRNKGKVNANNTGILPLKNSVVIYSQPIDRIPIPKIDKNDKGKTCKTCGLLVLEECVGDKSICECYRYAPPETDYARERRLAI